MRKKARKQESKTQSAILWPTLLFVTLHRRKGRERQRRLVYAPWSSKAKAMDLRGEGHGPRARSP